MSGSLVLEWKDEEVWSTRCQIPETGEAMAYLGSQKRVSVAGTWKIRGRERILEEKVGGK